MLTISLPGETRWCYDSRWSNASIERRPSCSRCDISVTHVTWLITARWKGVRSKCDLGELKSFLQWANLLLVIRNTPIASLVLLWTSWFISSVNVCGVGVFLQRSSCDPQTEALGCGVRVALDKFAEQKGIGLADILAGCPCWCLQSPVLFVCWFGSRVRPTVYSI